jgi:nucleoside-diphosphate-sugar epimerase
MRIFITGGTGFIGKFLCGALADHELMVLSRGCTREPTPCQILQGDLADLPAWRNRLAAFQPDVCVHLAWSNLPDYSLPNNLANFQAGLNLFQCLLEMKCKRIVVAGTCAEYGDLTGSVKEEEIPATQSQFAAFKSAQRVLGQSMFAQTNASFLWARPFYVYGPGQRASSLIPTTIDCLTKRTQPKIQTPNALQDFVHVEDVAYGLAKLAVSDAPAGTYNLGFGHPVLVRDLVNLIARMLDRSKIYPATGQIAPGFWANIERMRYYTGWTPTISLADGLSRLLDATTREVRRAG